MIARSLGFAGFLIIEMKNNKIILLGLFTLIFFGGGGILIIKYFHEQNFIDEIFKGWNVLLQILVGILYGLLSSALCVFIIELDFFKAEKEYYRDKVSFLNLNNNTIIFLSLCAGIGEEIFFRAALQPILGIWATAVIFVVLHGYINPKNWRISVYGITMILIMAGIGYLYQFVGLISVMVAHTVIDIILFRHLTRGVKQA